MYRFLKFITTSLISPNAGRIKIYTSGCPKNQNKCWNNTGSPPPTGSKNVVLKLRSNKSMVIAPANTGSDNNSKTNVTNILHKYNLIRDKVITIHRLIMIVVIILIAPIIDDNPARCNEKIQKSTLCVAWPMLLNGGYIVHPNPAPIFSIDEITNIKKAHGSNQKLKLFMRGKIISDTFKYTGNIQLPNPPITNGMIKKKIITNAWLVTITLYSCPLMNVHTQFNRIKTEYLNPVNPMNNANTTYNVPISLWFTLLNQRLKS